MREEFLHPIILNGLPMRVTLAGISYCDGSYVIRRNNSEITVIEYILDGEGYVECDGIRLKAQKDDIYILEKDLNHYYFSDSKNPWIKVFINIEGDLPKTILKEYGINDNFVFEGKNLKFLFEKLIKTIKMQENSPEVHAKLCAIFTEAVARIAIAKTTEKNIDEMDTLKNYLDINTNRIIKNAELAKLIYRSPDYTIKHFYKKFGITPYEYQISEKIIVARQLLKNTAMPIYEISNAVGYEDAQYFSSLFKKRCGMTPGAYRKS